MKSIILVLLVFLCACKPQGVIDLDERLKKESGKKHFFIYGEEGEQQELYEYTGSKGNSGDANHCLIYGRKVSDNTKLEVFIKNLDPEEQQILYGIRKLPDIFQNQLNGTKPLVGFSDQEPEGEPDGAFKVGDEVYHKLNNWHGIISAVRGNTYNVRFKVGDELKLIKELTAVELKKEPF